MPCKFSPTDKHNNQPQTFFPLTPRVAQVAINQGISANKRTPAAWGPRFYANYVNILGVTSVLQGLVEQKYNNIIK